LLVAGLIFMASCVEPVDLVPVASEGGLIELSNPALNYVVGDSKDYPVELKVMQTSNNTVTKIDVYCSFEMTKGGKKVSSNEVLMKTITITETKTHFVTFTINQAELIAGLKVDGVDVSSDDTQYSIGDTWKLRLESTLSNGNVHQAAKKVEVAVSTRFAGTYKVLDLAYYRLGVASPSYWLGHQVIIKSVDAATYVYQWGETIGWVGPLYFQVGADNKVFYPVEWDGVAQTLNGNRLTVPDRDPALLTKVIPLTATPNIVIKDDVAGKDRLILVYGYETAGSGPREFYEILEKVVD